MSDTIFKYPLDLTGIAVTNRVVNEPHTVSANSGRIFVPNYGPFFDNEHLSLVESGTGRVLLPNEDYVLVHYYREGSTAAAQAIYGAIRIIDPDFIGEVLYTGQQLGGEYSYSFYAIAQAVEAANQLNLELNWGELVGMPSRFPTEDHIHTAAAVYGLKSVVESLSEIARSIQNGSYSSQQLLLGQIRDKFAEFDTFTQALSDGFAQAADELALV